MRRIGFAIGAVLLLTATTCRERMRMRLAEDAQPGRPVFVATRRNKLPVTDWGHLKVTSCRPSFLEKTVWEIRRDSPLPWHITPDGGIEPDTVPEPGRVPVPSIVYGQVPPGYVEETPAEPLVPGQCYIVAASANAIGWMEIELLDDGRAVDRSRRLLASSWTRQMEQGAVGCVRGYRRARTPADSAAVDARDFPLADTTLSCGYLRERVPATLAESMSTERRVLLVGAYFTALVGLIILQDEIPPK